MLLFQVGSLQPGSLDHSAEDLLEIVTDDVFGVVAEEKDVAKIATKYREAKSTASYDTCNFLARFIS